MIRAQTLAVTLTDFGQDVDPVARLHAVIGLDVERPLWLDDLEHLQEKPQRVYQTSKADPGAQNQSILGDLYII